MWIVPKTLSAFVPDTEGLRMGLEERAWMLEQSAMWRSKPSSKQTWLRRLKKGGWITPLSTRILKPSQQESFEEKFTDSLEDIPVNRSVVRGSEKAKKTQGTYGHTSENMSGQLDLFGASLKMSEVTPRWGYGESCPIWKKMVTERSGACSARRKQARLTNASDASFWRNYPTPEAHTVEKYSLQKDGQKKTQRSRNLTAMAINGELAEGMRKDETAIGTASHAKCQSLEDAGAITERCNAQSAVNGLTLFTTNYPKMDANIAEQNWPTPRAGNPGSRKPGTGGKILAEEAKKNWLTPRTGNSSSTQCRGDRKGPNGENIPSSLDSQVPAEEAKKNWDQHAGPPAQEKSSTSGKNLGSPKLNPSWVEQLMGLPVGWTQLPTAWTDSASSETALSPKPQN
jgi:hypothetical protein